MAEKNFMNVYDQMQSGQVSGDKITKKAIEGVVPAGGMDMSQCTEAYDQIFNQKPTAQPQNVLTEASSDMRFKRMGALQFLKEQLNKEGALSDVDNTVNMLKEIISTL